MRDQALGQSRRPGPDVLFLTFSPSSSLIQSFSSFDSSIHSLFLIGMALSSLISVLVFEFYGTCFLLSVTSVLDFFELFEWLLVGMDVAPQRALGARKHKPQHCESNGGRRIFPCLPCISLVRSVLCMEWLLNEFDTADKNGHFNRLDVSSGGRMKSS
jgi:hypothetical protein